MFSREGSDETGGSTGGQRAAAGCRSPHQALARLEGAEHFALDVIDQGAEGPRVEHAANPAERRREHLED